MSLRAYRQLISQTERELTTGSNCKGKQMHGEILQMQLSKKAGLTIK